MTFDRDLRSAIAITVAVATINQIMVVQFLTSTNRYLQCLGNNIVVLFKLGLPLQVVTDVIHLL